MPINRFPPLPELEWPSSSTTCMLCKTLWTIQLSWNLHHSHKQTEKSKSVTHTNGAQNCNILRVQIQSSLYWQRSAGPHLQEFLMRWHMSPTTNQKSTVILMVWQTLQSELLSYHNSSRKTGSEAFLRCFTSSEDCPQNCAWEYKEESSTPRPCCWNSCSIKNGIHDL